MSEHSFDVAIVGSGTSAYYAASRLNEAGKRVAMIDARPFGGTCALRGCQPKKYLVCNAEAVAMADHLVGRGIQKTPRTDWTALQALKDAFLERRSEKDVESWHKAGVATFHGAAVMTDLDKVTVGEDCITASYFVLATGATPRRTPIAGSELVHDSEFFLNLATLPRRIVFIGGGYISFEFAHVAIRAGAEQVAILHRSTRPLKAFDQEIVKIILAASEAAGIRVVLEESPRSVKTAGDALAVTGDSGGVYEADLVIEATGRIPNLSVLEGGAANVDHSSRGIAVNAYLQSVSNPLVYAVGDCADTPFQLAPMADEEGKMAAQNILEGNVRQVDYSIVPSAVFTIPSLGSVGLTEDQAREMRRDFRVNRGATTAWPSSRRIGEEHAGYKILIDNRTDEIIGAHLVRHNASEAINVLALAMRFGIKASELAEFPWAYPTLTSDLKYMVGRS